MNSCLYKARVMHNRLGPKPHRFHYDIFMFYLDLDEIDGLAGRMKWMSRNRWNLFNFRDKDHLQLPADAPDRSKPIRQHLTEYLHAQGVNIGKGRVQLLTNLCTLGYQFNPVSFYFCYDEGGDPLCSVVEVGNTFREMKLFFLGRDSMQGSESRQGGGNRQGGEGPKGGAFRSNLPKFFYVSPFIDMDTHFDFDLEVPDENLRIKIDDYDREGKRFFISTLSGRRKELTDANLLRYFFSFPLITLKVIGLIHWEALRLWLKKLPFHKKADRKDLQREVLRPYKSI